ncbi:hypothetical protein GYH30_019361 [Glycine max]|nr:hypothetical protein GYH30_019361 [Glycine max]
MSMGSLGRLSVAMHLGRPANTNLWASICISRVWWTWPNLQFVKT